MNLLPKIKKMGFNAMLPDVFIVSLALLTGSQFARPLSRD